MILSRLNRQGGIVRKRLFSRTWTSAIAVFVFCSWVAWTPLAHSEEDPSSFSNPHEISVDHLDLNLAVDFDRRVLKGKATWNLIQHQRGTSLVLDTSDLKIEKVEVDGKETKAFSFGIPGSKKSGFGQPLKIEVATDAKKTATKIAITYETAPHAEALQWLDPLQTANGLQPYLYSQSQPNLARTWVPCQDTPSVRFDYTARVTVPPQLLAVMSAENPKRKNTSGVYTFRMPQKIPSYLLALAVGDLEYRAYDKRAGVYTESKTMDRAHSEFVSLPKMIQTAEKLYGPYRWGQYDILVLPPSFPFGGMENPRLSFVTPSLLAGDHSLVSVVAHELAHSWTGNLVTNANVNHFWLNEAFTSFAERRILDALVGVEGRELQAKEGETGLIETIRDLSKKHPEYTKLRMNLPSDVNPDDAFSSVPYEKGYLFLRWIESHVGKAAMDRWIRAYVKKFEWQSITTEQFLEFLDQGLIRGNSELKAKLNIHEWVYEPGLPEARPVIQSKALMHVESVARKWVEKGMLDSKAVRSFSPYEWLHFFSKVSGVMNPERFRELESCAALSRSKNAEIAFGWIKLGLEAKYEPTLKWVEPFLGSIGRGKFVNPIFQRLIERVETRPLGRSLYEKFKPRYHAIVTTRVEKLLASFAEPGK